ncbi:hypothetical protein MTR_2g445130 [Medicago truncatula]|uniref:Uncharacterized protein n=1 Tax=Medicago truncatula TaxID=3880 RepID=A0A072VHQ8_MEDTR|nr:hypothetical protein MTR_2g445130 [Medicago truncatula]
MLDSGNLAPSPPLSAPCSVTDAAPAAPNAASGSSDNGSSAYARVLKRTREWNEDMVTSEAVVLQQSLNVYGSHVD